MKIDHRHFLLRKSSDFQKLTFEFLFVSIINNIQYIFLALQLLNIIGIVNFNPNPDYFPSLSLRSEIAKFEGFGFNPITIYLHFIYIFFLVVKSVTLTFIDNIRASTFASGIIAILLANMYLLYRGMSYGSAREHWKRRSIFKFMFADILKSGNLLEDALFMMLLIDMIVFITTPEKSHIYLLIAVYLIMLSIKLTPKISNFIADSLNAFQQSFFHNPRVLLSVAILDIIAVYFDSRSMFTLFLLVIAYTGIATIILKITKRYARINDILYYALYFGLFVFYLSIVAIFAVSFAIVAIAQLPIILYYAIRKKKLAPSWLMQIINGIFIFILLMIL